MTVQQHRPGSRVNLYPWLKLRLGFAGGEDRFRTVLTTTLPLYTPVLETLGKQVVGWVVEEV